MATAKKPPAASPEVKTTIAASVPAKKTAPPKTPAAAPKTPSAARKPAAKPAVSEDKTDKQAKKPKLVRDSFTIPKAEYAVLDELKQRLNILSKPSKKSEVLRAGIKLLAGLNDTGLVSALAAVPAVKTGRPNKSTSG
jgi:hypothetical protein